MLIGETESNSNPAFMNSLNTPATYYDSSPFGVVQLNDGQDTPQGAFPGGFFPLMTVNRAYGGDVNRSVMNGQNGMSASDKIDNRIMKNLEFQNKFNMGGRTMSTYDKLRSIADSIAEG